MRTENRK